MTERLSQSPLELWFEFASTYSYLTVMRVEELAGRSNVAVVWRPFLLGPIFKAKGWDTSPFVIDETKGRYMWRDIERRAAKYGLAFKRPTIFPANGLSAARIMTAALSEAWCGDFARAVFVAQFVDGADISNPETLAEALGSVGVDPHPWIEAARSDDVKAALRRRSQEAQSYGVFGAPSYRVGGELFWGDDRLEDAIEWACNRQ